MKLVSPIILAIYFCIGIKFSIKKKKKKKKKKKNYLNFLLNKKKKKKKKKTQHSLDILLHPMGSLIDVCVVVRTFPYKLFQLNITEFYKIDWFDLKKDSLFRNPT